MEQDDSYALSQLWFDPESLVPERWQQDVFLSNQRRWNELAQVYNSGAEITAFPGYGVPYCNPHIELGSMLRQPPGQRNLFEAAMMLKGSLPTTGMVDFDMKRVTNLVAQPGTASPRSGDTDPYARARELVGVYDQVASDLKAGKIPPFVEDPLGYEAAILAAIKDPSIAGVFDPELERLIRRGGSNIVAQVGNLLNGRNDELYHAFLLGARDSNIIGLDTGIGFGWVPQTRAEWRLQI